MSTPLWFPDANRIEKSRLTAFKRFVSAKTSRTFETEDHFHAFSVQHKEEFWPLLIEFTGIKAHSWGETILSDGDKMPGAKFFPDALLNYAQNMLQEADERDAIVFWGEDQVKTRLSRKELYDHVSKLVQHFDSLGLKKGDRVCAMLPNMPETIIAMLAATAKGLIWSSTSPDFGVDGVLDRFGQIEPKVFICVDGYHYNGKRHDVREKTQAIRAQIPSLVQTIQVPYLGLDVSSEETVSMETVLAQYDAQDIMFEPVEFNHPLFIMFSSGTTGKPKCILHSTGGILLKHVSEHALHGNAGPGSRVFFFTTCGWMMWNWLVGALTQKACVLLYDGSPFLKDGQILFDYIDQEKIEFFGTGAKFIDALAKSGLSPKKTHDLSSLQILASTGSPLIGASFDYIYQEIKTNLQVASISGGTDILGCFVLGHPHLPVYRGEIQAKALGMDTDVFNASGAPVIGEKGELVCKSPFPSMPVGFWDDPEEARYRKAYFETFENIWHHGDFVQINPDTGGFEIFGRSDATLNPGGVRIGTAEIYRQVDTMDEIMESVVVGQDVDGDVRVVLFVVMQAGYDFNEDLVKRIKARIREGCTPRHVPAVVLPCPDIPRTKSGKISEISVRDLINHKPIENKGALANPEILDFFSGVVINA